MNCPHCEGPLPEGASFCPGCARSVNLRVPAPSPWLVDGRVIRGGTVFLVFLLAALAVFGFTRPRTFEGVGEVVYTDRDGSYPVSYTHLWMCGSRHTGKC